MTDVPKTPPGLAARGKRLWKSIHEEHPTMSEPETEVALEACRVADRLDRLDVICRDNDPIFISPTGNMIAHPAFAEARQQGNLLKQLIAALRIPDEQTGKRPQTRPARGATATHGAGKGSVSSLDKFRRAAAG